MESNELIQALRADAEWAHANEWETPITLGDHLDAAADALATLLAEVKRLNEENKTLSDYIDVYTDICDQHQKTYHKLMDNLASVTAERDEAASAVAKMAEYIVTLGGADYHLCDVIPQEHHLKYQSKNDGDYDNEPCIECVKAYFMSGAGKEQNDGK